MKSQRVHRSDFCNVSSPNTFTQSSSGNFGVKDRMCSSVHCALSHLIGGLISLSYKLKDVFEGNTA